MSSLLGPTVKGFVGEGLSGLAGWLLAGFCWLAAGVESGWA